MNKVKTLITNWHQVGSVTDRDGAGEDYYRYTVGLNGVTDIIENEPKNGNDVWNYEILKEDGTRSRAFNPNHVEYFKEG